MIKELSDALGRLINSLSMRPLATIVAIFIIGLSYVAFRSYDTIQQMVISPDEEALKFQAQLESSALVNTAIENLRGSLGAHSVFVKQFHNGRHDLTGLPFTEATDTFYTDGYENVGNESLSAMNSSLRSMWQRIDKPECIIMYSPQDISTRKYFAQYKLHRAVLCPLTNLLNYPIGTITVGFSDRSTISDEVAITRTSAMAKRITGYLNGN